MSTVFSYDEAFSRNIGWATPVDQETLRHKHVAIKGICYRWYPPLLTLTRLGIDAFLIANFVVFSLVDFNRQAAAGMSTLGWQKIDVMVQLAKDVVRDWTSRHSLKALAKTVCWNFFQVLTCALTASITSPYLRAKPVSPPRRIGYHAAPT